MTTPFDDIRVRQGRTLDEFQAPLVDVMAASAQQALYDNPSSQLFRLAEEHDLKSDEQVLQGYAAGKGYGGVTAEYAQVPRARVDAETAKVKLKEAGVSYSVPKEGMTEAWLNTLIKRRQEKAARDDIIKRAPSGSLPLQLAASFGASILDPINIATAFIPVVGPARYARMLEKASSVVGRAGIRTVVGGAEGAVGQAVLEPLTAYANSQEGIDYSMADSLRNIAFGGLLGGGLHVAGGALSDVLSRKAARGETDLPTVPKEKPEPGSAAATAERLPPSVSDVTLQTAIAQAASGREVDPASVADLAKSQDAKAPEMPSASVKEGATDSGRVEDSLTVEQVRADGGKYESIDANYLADYVEKSLADIPASELPAAIAAKREELQQLSQSVENKKTLAQSASAAKITPDELKMKVSQQVEFEGKLLDAYEREAGISKAGSPESVRPVDTQQARADLSSVRQAAETNQRPEAAQGVDFTASKQADTILDEAPKTEDLAAATEAASLAEQDLKELADQLGMDSAKLSESINEDVKRANSYAKAARAAVVCNLRT